MPVELKVPAAGESITEVQIGAWKVAEGDQVAQDALLVDIETDKITVELPAPVSGKITEIRLKEGDQAQVGDVLGMIEEGDAPAGDAPASDAKPESNGAAASSNGAPASAAAGDALVMPAAQRVIDENKLDASQITGTGPGGRILKSDVEQFIKQGGGTKPAAATPAASPAAAPAATGPRHEEAKPMTPLRRTIARRLVEAQQTGALLTTFNEVDMTAVMDLRKQYKDGFEKRHGVKLGFMSFFVKAAVDALQQYPAINAEVRDETIVYKDYCDVGVAIGGGRGLVVPVLRNAEGMSFAEIEKTIGEFAVKARDNKLTMDELTGGTFTITNGGVFGSLLSTPIINPPQSGVLGMHSIQQRAMVIDGQIVARPMMYLALTYDHRIVDGREAVTFLVRIKQTLEDPARMLMEV